MKGHSCPRINTMSLTYSSGSGITVRLSNCNDYVLGDLVEDPIELIMKRRQEVRMTLIKKHLIHGGCIEHCFAVSQMRRDGFIRAKEFDDLKDEDKKEYQKTFE